MSDAPDDGSDVKRGAPGAVSQNLIDKGIRFGLLALLAYWSYLLLEPFVELILWSVILAVTVYPAYRMLLKRVGGRATVAASLITTATFVLLVGPAALLADSLVQSSNGFYQSVKSGQPTFLPAPESLRSVPVVGEWLFRRRQEISTNLTGCASQYSADLLSAGQWLVVRVARVGGDLLVFAAAHVLAGYLLIVGDSWTGSAIRLMDRASPEQGERLAELISQTIRNVAAGVIGVALLQAAAGGLVMLIFGMEAAGVLALLALVMGIIQIGVGVVFTPVAIYGLFTMDLSTGIPMAVLLIGIAFIDTYLKPMVMRRGLSMPTIFVFFGLIGGVALHGFVGVFLGPVILAVGHSLALQWMKTERTSD